MAFRLPRRPNDPRLIALIKACHKLPKGKREAAYTHLAIRLDTTPRQLYRWLRGQNTLSRKRHRDALARVLAEEGL